MTDRTERVRPGDLPKGGALSQRLYSRREMVRFLAAGGAGLAAAPVLAPSRGFSGGPPGSRCGMRSCDRLAEGAGVLCPPGHHGAGLAGSLTDE